MKGKSMWIVVSVILILGLLVGGFGCKAPEVTPTPSPAPTPKPTPTPTPKPTAPPPAQPKVFKWRMQSLYTGAEPGFTVRQGTLDMVKKASGGQLIIELFPAGSIVEVADVHHAVGDGVLEMAEGTGAYWSGEIPVGGVETYLPFALRTYAELEVWYYNLGFREILQEAYAPINVYHLAQSHEPGPGLMSKVPIKSLADLKGLKIRSIGTVAKLMDKLGARGVYVPFAEVYTALATGVIDGQVSASPGELVGLKFHEVAKYWMKPEPVFTASANFLINLNIWKELPDNLKAVLELAGRWDINSYGAFCVMDSGKAMKKMQGEGLIVTTLPEGDVAKIQAAALEVWDELAAKDPLSARAIKLVKDFMTELGYIK